MSYRLFILILTGAACFFSGKAHGQLYTVGNAHSHNDYVNDIPFYRAFNKGFASIEADIFPVNGDLLVAHDSVELNTERTLLDMYIKPAAESLKGSSQRLQLLVDIKKDHREALKLLIKQLEPYRALLSLPERPAPLTIVISGDRPSPSLYHTYPDYIWFDGDLKSQYTEEQWKRVGLVSFSFTDFSKWNGLGRPVAGDRLKLKKTIDKVHSSKKKIRFWAAPDTPSSWLEQMNMGVDLIGTDQIEELGTFLSQLPKNHFHNSEPYPVYSPSYKSDGKRGKVKNIILLIGDGMGLAHVYSTYTANRGALNIFAMNNIGLSITPSADAYGTDSAAGATAIATGQKTNNRFIGVDTAGRPLKTIISYASDAGKKTALITAESVTGATPAAFYAHENERDSATAIAADLLNSPVDIVVGSGQKYFQTVHNGTNLYTKLKNKGFSVVNKIEELTTLTKLPVLVLLPDSATRPISEGRGDMLLGAFNNTLNMVRSNKKGFFMMLEGPKIDNGGHTNNLPLLITENADFDRVVGEALKFADKDGETLVIVTADHETGGLTLLNGDVSTGSVTAAFSTGDHTGIPVPVFSYGPYSDRFKGIYQNNEIGQKILELLE